MIATYTGMSTQEVILYNCSDICRATYKYLREMIWAHMRAIMACLSEYPVGELVHECEADVFVVLQQQMVFSYSPVSIIFGVNLIPRIRSFSQFPTSILNLFKFMCGNNVLQ